MSRTQIPLERHRIEVGLHDVHAVLEAWTGIPSDRLAVSGFSAGDLGVLSDVLSAGIFGQKRAIESCVSGIRRRFQLPERPGERRPIWTALFAGPSGVGKTQLACELATHFFGDLKNHLVKVDLSELREDHTVSRLVGSPPGYVGHGQGGELTNALRKSRTGVLVLDEVEKAHPSILTTVVLPMLGEAVVHDMNDGRVLDVSNMVVILTTNLGTNRAGQQMPGFSAHSAIDPRRARHQDGHRGQISSRSPRPLG
jgi:ATP-dependent Clp protease ATP-binding subunit ClpA